MKRRNRRFGTAGETRRQRFDTNGGRPEFQNPVRYFKRHRQLPCRPRLSRVRASGLGIRFYERAHGHDYGQFQRLVPRRARPERHSENQYFFPAVRIQFFGVRRERHVYVQLDSDRGIVERKKTAVSGRFFVGKLSTLQSPVL